jgi:hypothetical protein
MKKYSNYQFELLGHSQSGVIVNDFCSKKVRNCISLNPAYRTASFKNNKFLIKSTGDMVSQCSKKNKNSVCILNGLKIM